MPPFLSIVIPAYNEEKRLPETLRRVQEFLGQQMYASEVLVVDDGSRDATAVVAGKAAASWPELRLLKNPGNRGKGYSVRHGMLEARGEWALFSDADLSAPIEEAARLLEKTGEGFDVVIGSRAVNRQLIGVRQSAWRETSGQIFNLVMRALTGLPFRDTQCGFKLFRHAAAQAIFGRQRIDGFGFDVEALYLARKLGFRSAEVAVRWNNVEGTKVSMLSGLDAFTDLARIRWWDARGLYSSNKSPVV